MPAHASTCVLLVSQRQDELEALRAVAETDWHGLRAVTDVREACALLRAEEIAVVVARLDEPGADAAAPAPGGHDAYVVVPAGDDGMAAAIIVAVERGTEPAVSSLLLQLLAETLAAQGGAAGLQAQLDGWCDLLFGTLLTALDVHDVNTAQHSERAADLAVELAREMEYAEGSVELTELRRGTLLHDIGKLGVHTAILQKWGPLNDVEWDEMRLHPGYGHQILEEIPSLAGAAEIVHCLHERWDGGGYPHGLRGTRFRSAPASSCSRMPGTP